MRLYPEAQTMQCFNFNPDRLLWSRKFFVTVRFQIKLSGAGPE
jgi:hypothetical protein